MESPSKESGFFKGDREWWTLSAATIVLGFVLVLFGKEIGDFAVLASFALATGNGTQIARNIRKR